MVISGGSAGRWWRCVDGDCVGCRVGCCVGCCVGCGGGADAVLVGGSVVDMVVGGVVVVVGVVVDVDGVVLVEGVLLPWRS